MKAYLVTKYKSPMEAGHAPEPTVGDRDVLVDVHAAGVNLLDAKVRDGDFKLILPYKPPFILGHDLARRIPNSKLTIYPGSGHGGVFQHHREFVPAVLEFLES